MIEAVDEWVYWPAVIVVLVLGLGAIAGYAMKLVGQRLLTAAGVPTIVEGTAFERTSQSIGTSTVHVISRLAAWFIYGLAILAVIYYLFPVEIGWVWQAIVSFLPQLFIAVVVLIIGFILGDKGEILVAERLRGYKIPELAIIPKTVRYSILLIATVIALAQVGVRTDALVVFLAMYFLALIAITIVATKDLLRSATAGMYLLLHEPYAIGDEIELNGVSGIVQEVDLFVTKLEQDEEVYVIPNRRVLQEGVRKSR